MKVLYSDTDLRPGQVARMVGRSYQTLWQWGNKGQGPPFTVVQGRRRYRLGDVVEWLQHQDQDDDGEKK